MGEFKLAVDKSFYEPEAKELIVSSDRKRLWAALLDLYVEFKRVCEENGLKFFADSGTLIGALRHGGFIPWDDDLDFVMLREDYEKLCKIAPTAFKAPYFWQTNESDPGSCRGHGQLRNSSTTAILKSEMRDGRPIYGFNQGLFLDVFQLDNVPDDPKEREAFCRELIKQKKRIYKLRWLLSEFRFSKGHRFDFTHYKLWFKKWRALILKRFFGRDVLKEECEKLEKMARRYNGVKTEYCAPIEHLPCRKASDFYKVEGYKDFRMAKFEMLEVPVQLDAEERLENEYGSWREHVIGVNIHGSVFIDLEKPYTEYLRR